MQPVTTTTATFVTAAAVVAAKFTEYEHLQKNCYTEKTYQSNGMSFLYKRRDYSLLQVPGGSSYFSVLSANVGDHEAPATLKAATCM